MSTTLGWLSIVPPVLAIAIALTTRRVLLSLLAGGLCATLILNLDAPYRTPARTVDELVAVLAQPDSLRLVLFCLLIGSMLRLMKDSRGFDALALSLQRHRGTFGNRTAFGLTWLFGATLILETWSNVLINGATMTSIYDRLGISRARLAYFIHTIGINVVALVLINSWGAFYLALVTAQNVVNPFEFLMHSMPFAIYCWVSLALVAFVMVSGLSIGPMRAFEASAARQQRAEAAPAVADARTLQPKLRHMMIPIATLICGVLISLWVTGDGNVRAGDGSRSILYAVLLAIVMAALLLRIDRVFSSLEIEKKIIAGSAELLDVAFLIVLALALGKLTHDMGTGAFIAQQLQSSLPPFVLPALIFVLGAAMSFATGTSYGTFSILVPIALPIGQASGISQELLFGACIAGGVFGDNCSPLSDTSIVTSVAAGTSVIDHVQTQLPYALIAAAISAVAYLALGLM
jgi:Na+/H+ antiporter NhaC